jgi:hypothetical protein
VGIHESLQTSAEWLPTRARTQWSSRDMQPTETCAHVRAPETARIQLRGAAPRAEGKAGRAKAAAKGAAASRARAVVE